MKYIVRPITCITIFGLFLFVLPAGASDSPDWAVTFSFRTQHINPSDDTNEETFLIAISYKEYILARFINSYHDATYFVGRRFHTKKISHRKYENFYIQGNLYFGLMYGYKDNLPDLVPRIGEISAGLFPTFGLGYGRTSIEIGYIPTPKGGVAMGLFRIALPFYQSKNSSKKSSEKKRKFN